ncbi:MAG: hypothetical protein J5I93_11215 [Pirellulaceae bacterium]|nr:hypothetical protein [Pirellulaceae bacterium]
MKRFGTCSGEQTLRLDRLWLLLAVLAVAATGEQGVLAEPGGPAPAAPLVSLAAAPELLQPPDGLSGDFQVARTPPRLQFAVFPGQTEDARLWSSWGDALYASDGHFYTSLGDHDAPHGTAYVYRVDPAAGTVTLVVDYNRLMDRGPTQYTPGKIHGAIVEGNERGLYFFGYRGSVRQTTAEADYQGDWLLRYDLQAGKAENLGIAVPFSSVPVLAETPDRAGLYGLSVPGLTMPEPASQFFHYDLAKRRLLFHAPVPADGPRCLVVGRDGLAWFGVRDEPSGEGKLVCYDPVAAKLVETGLKIPGDGMLRAATHAGSDGVAWCISKDGIVFALDTNRRKIRVLGPSFVAGKQYNATCRLDPSERFLYYVPEAHGGSSKIGSPVIQLDVKTGQRKVLAFLSETLRKQQAYNLGGTYGIALSDDGSQLMINWNGSRWPATGRQTEFGLCAAMVLHIPESERTAAAP